MKRGITVLNAIFFVVIIVGSLFIVSLLGGVEKEDVSGDVVSSASVNWFCGAKLVKTIIGYKNVLYKCPVIGYDCVNSKCVATTTTPTTIPTTTPSTTTPPTPTTIPTATPPKPTPTPTPTTIPTFIPIGADKCSTNLMTLPPNEFIESLDFYNSNTIVYAKKGKVYTYDIINKIEKKIYNPNSLASMVYYLDVYGDFAVWVGGGKINVYNLKEDINKVIKTVNGAGIYISIYKNKVVYQTYNSLYLYDLETDIETKIADQIRQPSSYPKIYGDKVVWVDFIDPSKQNIFMYDLNTKTKTQITGARDTSSTISIYESLIIDGNKIVFINRANSLSSLGVYDLGLGKTRMITPYNFNMRFFVFGNKIVWSNYNGQDVYIYDLLRNINIDVSTNKNKAFIRSLLSIYGDIVVYYDYNVVNGISNPSIYAYDLSCAGLA